AEIAWNVGENDDVGHTRPAVVDVGEQRRSAAADDEESGEQEKPELTHERSPRPTCARKHARVGESEPRPKVKGPQGARNLTDFAVRFTFSACAREPRHVRKMRPGLACRPRWWSPRLAAAYAGAACASPIPNVT